MENICTKHCMNTLNTPHQKSMRLAHRVGGFVFCSFMHLLEIKKKNICERLVNSAFIRVSCSQFHLVALSLNSHQEVKVQYRQVSTILS